MTIKQLRDDFYTASGTLSDNARKLAFSGIAIIWIFTKLSDSGAIEIPSLLKSALLWLVFMLVTDMLQYSWKTITLKIVLDQKLKLEGRKDDTEVIIPSWVNNGTWILFILKIVLLVIGYIQILKYMI